VAVPASLECSDQASAFNTMVQDCTGTAGVLGCEEVGAFRLLTAAPQVAQCNAVVSTLQFIVNELAGPGTTVSLALSCAADGDLVVNTGNCSDVVAHLNNAIDVYSAGEFIDCRVTTVT
jgi:hypothetical protein